LHTKIKVNIKRNIHKNTDAMIH